MWKLKPVCLLLLLGTAVSDSFAPRHSFLQKQQQKHHRPQQKLARGAAVLPVEERVPRGGAIQRNPAPPPGTLSATGSLFSLTKNIVGAGILCLAAGMAAGKGTGFVPAVALVLFSCILSTYSFNLVGRVVDVTGAVDFRDLWSLTVGASSAWIVDFMIFGVAGGALLVYSMFLGDILNLLAPAAWALTRTKAILSVTAVLVPLCLLPDLSALAPMAYVGISAVLYSSWVVVKRFLDGTCAAPVAGAAAKAATNFFASLPEAPGTSQLSTARVSLGTCVLFNMLNTAYMAHTNAVRFYNELENRSPKKFANVVAGAFGISALLYCLVMSAGYATFGGASQGLILNNYANSDVLATLARAATGVSILGSYPLLFTSVRDVLVSTLKSSKSLAGFGAKASVPSSNAWKGLSMGILGLVTALAISIKDAGFVVSVSGASFGAALIFCVPAMIFLAAKKADDGNLLPTSKAEKMAVRGLFTFGASAGIFGTIITCLETFTTLLK